MTLYADSSALVKRYVIEDWSIEVGDLIDAADELATAAITKAEIAAAVFRNVREGNLDALEAGAAIAELGTHWPLLRTVPVDTALVERACDLAQAYPLKGYDAVQLAAALRTKDVAEQQITVAVFDSQLRAACLSEGLDVWDPTAMATPSWDSSSAGSDLT